ncbi:cytochrome o ubiquinol oxidase subunit IV [Sphingomonas jatrophae]|uniref:Cytochrome bo(3) ubiquinol oxidase subunit 4 n=1 Tax=Sphingomonas jatrophae TaxID=1166337 RepID=A0A1I6JAH6_9SPHN|nr:cytochrome o ubiquinol oxidase subunit IV [Sphingomonas jatrophae]SFR76003.1 cytochrome bo3 quinol oxidase subunit 4 [Sphingomonas jatrophae]
MSASGHQTQGHEAQHGDDAPHGSRRGYVIGFLLSAVLTAIPFALVMGGAFTDTRITAGLITVAAAIQIVVHMIYFLHMNTKSEAGWTVMALIFTAIIVVIVIAGSLWVMYNMNANMMPHMMTETGSGGM